MEEYINRKETLENLKKFAPEHLTPLIEQLITKQSAADVVEVIRCKDCKYRKKDKLFVTGHYCYLRPVNGGRFCGDDDYCSYGEPR